MNEPRAIPPPYDQPGKATAEGGVVLLDGPDGVAVTMTPDAAARTAESLRQAAEQAQATARQKAQ